MPRAKKATVAVSVELQTAVANLQTARREYKAAFEAYKLAAPDLSAARFWELLAAFRKLVAERLRSGREVQAAKQAAQEFARRAWVGMDPFQPDTLAEVAAFARRYAALSEELGAAFDALGDDLELERSDDAYSDLLDALPLAGKSVCERVLKKKFKTNGEFEKAVRAAVLADGPAVGRFILEGENYIDHCLDKALRHYLEHRVRDSLREKGDLNDADDDE